MSLHLRSLADVAELVGILGDSVRGMVLTTLEKVGETIADLGGDE